MRSKDVYGQTVARREIRAQLAAQPISLRRLASRIGLKGHGSLSRFLAAKQKLPYGTILEVCRELGVEGAARQRVIDAFALTGLPERQRATVRRAIETQAESDRPRLREARFFLNERVPYVYETLRLLRRATVAEIAAASHRRWRFHPEGITVCLEGLARLRLVAKDGEHWTVVDPSRDVVTPIKYSHIANAKVVRYALSMQQAFLEEGTESRLVRTVLTSLKVPAGRTWRELLAAKIAIWQDELLALQGDGDNTVINVVLGATEVARRDR